MANKLDYIKIKGRTVDVGLNAIGYKDKEEGVFVIHSPALDLYAYGKNQKQAFIAFEETLSLYIDYVMNEKTLEKDLKRLGWTRSVYFPKRLNPPNYNPNEIMSKKGISDFNIINKQMELQAA